MSHQLSVKRLFPSVTQIYEDVSTPPKQKEVEHPYDYIFRVYDNSSLNSRLTGLPGYSPPWFVRIINGMTVILSYITIALAFLFVFILGCTIIAASIEAISTVEFTVTIPYTGAELYAITRTDRQSFILKATPVLLSFGSFVVSMMVFRASDVLSKKLSTPYEDEYYEWLEELEPPENGFPAGLAYVWSGREFDYGAVPPSAPPAFRQRRRFETILYILKTGWLTIVAFFVQTMTLHMIVLYNQQQPAVEPPLDAIEDSQTTRKSRREKRD